LTRAPAISSNFSKEENMRNSIVAMAALASLLAGCAQDDFTRTEGLTLGIGDAVATNSALQIIDPWPAGVEDTALNPPADRGDPAAVKDAPAAPATAGGQP
jgi:hypothetical protein